MASWQSGHTPEYYKRRKKTQAERQKSIAQKAKKVIVLEHEVSNLTNQIATLKEQYSQSTLLHTNLDAVIKREVCNDMIVSERMNIYV
jgi:archaellum component FlaC